MLHAVLVITNKASIAGFLASLSKGFSFKGLLFQRAFGVAYKYKYKQKQVYTITPLLLLVA